MLTGVKLKNWQINDLEDIAICYQHNVPIKLLSAIYNRTPNSILKLMARTGLRALKNASRGASRAVNRKMYDTPETVHQLIHSIRFKYSTAALLHQYLNLYTPANVTTLAKRVKDVQTFNDAHFVIGQEIKGNWTSFHHLVEQARHYNHNIIVKNLSDFRNDQAITKMVVCDGKPKTIHELLLMVNRYRTRDKLPLLLLEGITDI